MKTQSVSTIRLPAVAGSFYPGDARMLARYGAACQPQARAPLASEVSELDSLLKRRHELEEMVQQERNRLQQLRRRPGIAAPV